MLVLFVGLCFVSSVFAHSQYQARIPNGYNVPDPCTKGRTWAAVGHVVASGGPTAKNQFGIDFKAQNHYWNKHLCQMDSDGDGLTNGWELGDPDCTWTASRRTDRPAVGHPGICDNPLELNRCASSSGFLCP